jgi:hypothetical protein
LATQKAKAEKSEQNRNYGETICAGHSAIGSRPEREQE